jgi:hypothetical protein
MALQIVRMIVLPLVGRSNPLSIGATRCLTKTKEKSCVALLSSVKPHVHAAQSGGAAA